MRISVPARYAFSSLVSVFMIWACAASALGHPRKYAQGPCGAMFGAKVCTIYQTRSGQVREFGLAIPLAAIQQAPSNPPMIWPPKPLVIVRFAPIVEAQTGFTFASVYLVAHGHPPNVYRVPHFDFHFYFIPEQQRQAIDCKNSSKPPNPPAGYTLPDVNLPPIGELVGICVPYMGMHAVPKADLALATPWAASMVVGYYGGKPIFIEPMVTHSRLFERRSFSLAIPRIEQVARVRYPRRFHAVYLAKSQTYDFIFSYWSP